MYCNYTRWLFLGSIEMAWPDDERWSRDIFSVCTQSGSGASECSECGHYKVFSLRRNPRLEVIRDNSCEVTASWLTAFNQTQYRWLCWQLKYLTLIFVTSLTGDSFRCVKAWLVANHEVNSFVCQQLQYIFFWFVTVTKRHFNTQFQCSYKLETIYIIY